MSQEESFDGSAERLRRESELRNRLQAALGAHFGNNGAEPLPPEMEQQFLEQVIAFHQQAGSHPAVPLSAYLGNPCFKPASGLSEDELGQAWVLLSRLLEEKGIRVDFLSGYSLPLKYDFITQELFNYETELPGLEGRSVCFIYEDFHPNHDCDIRRRTEEFMEGFFGGRFPEKPGWYLADELVSEEGRIIQREELHQLLDRFHGLFASIRDYDYEVGRITIQPEVEVTGHMLRSGYCEGTVSYTALLTDGSWQTIRGPFRLSLQCHCDWWEIVFFQVHGFTWKGQLA